MRTIHRAVGWTCLVVFLATGVSMRLHEPPMIEMAEGPRMLLRSRHIYVLMGALVNLAFEAQYRRAAGSIRRRLQRAGSSLVIAAPILANAAFLTEAQRAEMNGSLTPLAIICLVAGTVLPSFALWNEERSEN